MQIQLTEPPSPSALSINLFIVVPTLLNQMREERELTDDSALRAHYQKAHN